VLKKCKSILPVLLINYHEILDARGDGLKRSLGIVGKLLTNLDGCIKKKAIKIFITKVNEEKEAAIK